jgi:hypothetical protein
MSDDDLPLFDRFTLFFDFLGTSDATRWPKERLYPFLDLLISIAQIQSKQNIDGNPQEDGSYRIRITPEVTTFSDNIVVVTRPSATKRQFHRTFRNNCASNLCGPSSCVRMQFAS